MMQLALTNGRESFFFTQSNLAHGVFLNIVPKANQGIKHLSILGWCRFVGT